LTAVCKPLILAVFWAGLGGVAENGLERASQLYQRTEYQAALEILRQMPAEDYPATLLRGKCLYGLERYREATEALEAAVRLSPLSSEAHLWLGRAYGRRAETSSFVTAPGLASRARQHFERSVQLDPNNKEAVGDLFEYYLEAPGFLGGGRDKARTLAEKYRDADPAEYHYRLAQLALKKNDIRSAEEHLRKAYELEPDKAGRILDLAAFLAKQGKFEESDRLFDQAERREPALARVWFVRARAYIESRRNLGEARRLLALYLRASLTPDDPPRREAERLLKKAEGS